VKDMITLANVRMERKLIVVFLFLLILPISILSYFSYTNYAASVKNNTIVYVNEVSAQIISKLDDYIEDMTRVTAIPAYMDEIIEGLEMSNQYYSQVQHYRPLDQQERIRMEPSIQLSLQRKIESSINFINNIKKGASSVYLFDNFGNAYYRIKVGGVRSDINETYPKWRDKARAANGKSVLVSTQEFTNNLNSTKYVFTVVREVMNRTYESAGMIAVDANISVIEDLVKDLDQVTQGETMIVDEQNLVIFDSDMKYLTQDFSNNELVKRAAGPSGSFYATIDGEDWLVIYSQSPETKWKVFITMPVKELTKDVVMIRDVTMVVTLIITGFALIISIILSFAITKPLRKMMNLMKEVQNGNLNVSFSVKHRDEIGKLGSHFNRMILRIKQLIQEIYAMELRKKEAELNALQTQINPHFIYNTLESIRMTAEINNDEEVSDMTLILGKLLRYSINIQKGIVTVEQELEHLKNYVKLLNYRYTDKFSLRIALLPKAVLNYEMIKLIYQPIVENSMYHGLDEDKGEMTIDISYAVKADFFEIYILDNGLGMDNEILLKLQAALLNTDDSDPKGGIGLRNVNERIRLYYGNAYGLLINSWPGSGTEVTIRLPHSTLKEDSP
jgi:two-component system sensor histidine kinase YesM